VKVTVELPDELVQALAKALAQHLARSELQAAEVVTSRDCGRYGLSRARFRALCTTGQIPASRVGNRYTATAADVEHWMESQRVEARPLPARSPVRDVDDPVERALARGRLSVVRGRSI
jgi:hypothetical protein